MMSESKNSLMNVGDWNYPELEPIPSIDDVCREYLAARAQLDALDRSDAEFVDAEAAVIAATMRICFSASAHLAMDSTVYEMGRWSARSDRARERER